MVRGRTEEQIQAMLTRILGFANRICGKHRQSSMITNAEIQLISDWRFGIRLQYGFTVHKNKYLNFTAPLDGVFNNSLCLQDIRVENKAYFTMIHSLTIYVDEWSNRDTDNVLQFMQYMVKQCSRLDRLFVEGNIISNYVVFAPTALTGARDDSLPLNYVTTPTEDNILYASYSDMMLSNHFLQSMLQMFPNIQTVKLDRCEFKQRYIMIDLSYLLHLQRLELNLNKVCRKSRVRFEIVMDKNATVKYDFKRIWNIFELRRGPFKPVKILEDVLECENCAVITIFCFKINEIVIQLDCNNNPIYPIACKSIHMPPITVYPLLDILNALNN